MLGWCAEHVLSFGRVRAAAGMRTQALADDLWLLPPVFAVTDGGAFAATLTGHRICCTAAQSGVQLL